ASAVVHQVLSRRVLYLAVLLHDIAKGRGGDHSQIGAEIALHLGPRLGLSAEETEQVAWLVLHHRLMSNRAFKRGIDDARTVGDATQRLPRGTAACGLRSAATTVARPARLVRRAARGGAPPAIPPRVDPARASTEVTVYATDRLGLFSDLAGAFALARADIVD